MKQIPPLSPDSFRGRVYFRIGQLLPPNERERRRRRQTIEANAALREAFFGNAAEARKRVASAFALAKGRDVLYPAALALALAGDAKRAQSLANDLNRPFRKTP